MLETPPLSTRLLDQPQRATVILLCSWRNTLIIIGQIEENVEEGLSPFDAVVEATVQRARPVILTALAAILAFIPLTHSVFWGTVAYTLIGGTFAGTILTLIFLPAMYAIWFKIKSTPSHR